MSSIHQDPYHELRFPVGEYIAIKSPSTEQIKEWIEILRDFPKKLESTLQGATLQQLNWPYRPKGWAVKQVVHHCADSHMNAYIRFKLALTEDRPTIRPYFEDRWALLKDYQEEDLQSSLDIIRGLHARWSRFLEGLSKEQLSKEFIHPEHGKTFNLAENIGNYAWHCRHHLAHIEHGLNSGGIYL